MSGFLLNHLWASCEHKAPLFEYSSNTFPIYEATCTKPQPTYQNQSLSLSLVLYIYMYIYMWNYIYEYIRGIMYMRKILFPKDNYISIYISLPSHKFFLKSMFHILPIKCLSLAWGKGGRKVFIPILESRQGMWLPNLSYKWWQNNCVIPWDTHYWDPATMLWGNLDINIDSLGYKPTASFTTRYEIENVPVDSGSQQANNFSWCPWEHGPEKIFSNELYPRS
jgi:hypothetical protein